MLKNNFFVGIINIVNDNNRLNNVKFNKQITYGFVF